MPREYQPYEKRVTTKDGLTIKLTNNIADRTSYDRLKNRINIALGNRALGWLETAVLLRDGVCSITIIRPETFDRQLTDGISPVKLADLEIDGLAYVVSSFLPENLRRMSWLPADLEKSGRINKSSLKRSSDFAIPGKPKEAKALNADARDLRRICGTQMLFIYNYLRDSRGMSFGDLEQTLTLGAFEHEKRHSEQSKLFPGIELLHKLDMEGIMEYYERHHDDPFKVDEEFVQRYLSMMPQIFRVLSLIETDAQISGWTDRPTELFDQLELYSYISGTLSLFEAEVDNVSAFEKGLSDIRRIGYPDKFWEDDLVFEEHVLGYLSIFTNNPDIYTPIISGSSTKITAQKIATDALRGMRQALESYETFSAILRQSNFRERLNAAIEDGLKSVEAVCQEFYSWLDSRNP